MMATIDVTPTFESEDIMKAITKLTVAAMIGAAAGAIAAETTYSHVKLRVTTDATGAVAGYADWQSAISESFGARVLARGGSGDTLAGAAPGASPNPFEGMDKMQRLPPQPAGYR
jgi:hypothetical protein